MGEMCIHCLELKMQASFIHENIVQYSQVRMLYRNLTNKHLKKQAQHFVGTFYEPYFVR